MSNLGFQSLFHRTASFRGVRAARFFLEKGNELFSPEAADPRKTELFPAGRVTLKGWDALFFSVSYELDYPNILEMLKRSAIPLLAEHRLSKPSEGRPFTFLGGIAVSANPEIMAPFADAVFIGDMEVGLDPVLENLHAHRFKTSAAQRGDLDKIPGVYVPAGGTAPRRAIAETVSEPAHTAVLTKRTEFSDIFLVEIVRGCASACNFCMTRCVSGPVRSVKPALILERVRRAAHLTGKAGLIGPVLTDHRELAAIVEGINGLGCTVSFSSLRADRFDEPIAALLEKNGQSSVTFAPETGSPGLQRRIGKGMEGDAVRRAVGTALEHGLRKFRFYLMYGLPGETLEDIDLTAEFVRSSVRVLGGFPGTSLHLSFNPFIPKRGTPFEGEGIRPMRYYDEAKERLRGGLRGAEGITLRFESLRQTRLHYLLSVGGREIGLALGGAVEKGSVKELERWVGENGGIEKNGG
jgi:radical SAM superfamily enzyme YgiQ (UPF0313 family)